MDRYRISLFFAAVVILIPIVTGGGIGQATAQAETATSGSIIDLENEEVNIQLQAQQRTVEHGEPVILTLSAASYVTNSNPITVQLIIESPSGVSVTSTTAEQGSGNQFSTVTKVEPGASESLRVVVDPSEPGTYEITSEVVYFVGDNRNASTGERTSISITQNPPSRGLLWYFPTIFSFSLSILLTYFVVGPSNIRSIKSGYANGETALNYLFMSAISIGMAVWYFSTDFVIGVYICAFCLVIGAMSVIFAAYLDYFREIRVVFACFGMIFLFAIPIHLVIGVMMELLSL